MKRYHVSVTDDAKADILRYRDYLIYVKKNPQAARNLIHDYKETRKHLEDVAGSIKDPDSEKLKERGLKRINFLKHDYFILYTIRDNLVFVTNVFHSLEDYENKLR